MGQSCHSYMVLCDVWYTYGSLWDSPAIPTWYCVMCDIHGSLWDGPAILVASIENKNGSEGEKE